MGVMQEREVRQDAGATGGRFDAAFLPGLLRPSYYFMGVDGVG